MTFSQNIFHVKLCVMQLEFIYIYYFEIIE